MDVFHRIALPILALLLIAGCKSHEQELREERAAAESNRRMYQNALDEHPIGSRYGTHPDTMRIQGYEQAESARIRAIDRELGR